MRPVVRSWIGAAAQLQRCTGRTKCSAERIVTGESSRRAVPGALVPAWASSHWAPSTNEIASAFLSTPVEPDTHSSCPCSSATAMTASHSCAAWPSTSDSSGKICASGCSARYWRSTLRSRVMGGSLVSALIPAATERSHESATISLTPAVPPCSMRLACASRMVTGPRSLATVLVNHAGTRRAYCRPTAARAVTV